MVAGLHYGPLSYASPGRTWPRSRLREVPPEPAVELARRRAELIAELLSPAPAPVTRLCGGRFTRPVWLRLFLRSEWSRTLARDVWLRSWRYSAVISKTTLKKTVSEDRDFLFDFSRAPEILAGATVASATVAAESGLTVGSGVVLAATLDGVAAGQGVTCEVSGGTAGTSYGVSCTATLSTGRKLVLPGTVAVFSDFGR